MKIVVIGGTGLIGSKTVALLRERGHDVLSASPASGVDTLTGVGLDDALKGAEVVVDLANAPSWEEKAVVAFFEKAGSNLFPAEKKAGVKHHVALSVVGTDDLAAAGAVYFRGKIAQEKLIRAGGVPYTIVHSTQFFEFLGGIADAGADGDTVRLSTGNLQAIASDDVAAAMADYALGQPVNGIVEIAGPRKERMAEVIKRYLAATKDTRKVVADADTLYFGARLTDDMLCPRGPNPRLGKLDFEAWFALPKPPRK
jgi:uncharacterized protein YbjT (DUF2867 family)